MNLKKTKILIALFFLLFTMFLSNDFGLINIEKTAIVTALAIDKGEKDKYYSVTAQIAVPEANTSKTENSKAVITGDGDTVSDAIKNIGSISGWYPKLSFCNLIIIGNDLKGESAIKELDFFAKTLNVQDSSLVVLADKSAKEILETATPFDAISSFALQKVLLKEPGFDSEVFATDLRTFVQGAYSKSGSSFMPLIKIIEQTSSSKQSSSENTDKGNSVFDATTTALFLDGKFVGSLPKNLTYVYKLLNNNGKSPTYTVSEVVNDKTINYLINVLNYKPKIKVEVKDNKVYLFVDLRLYCKIADVNAEWQDSFNSRNVPLPQQVIELSVNKFYNDIVELISTLKETKCDLLGIKEKIYKYNYDNYSAVKDFCSYDFTASVKVSVEGQK